MKNQNQVFLEPHLCAAMLISPTQADEVATYLGKKVTSKLLLKCLMKK